MDEVGSGPSPAEFINANGICTINKSETPTMIIHNHTWLNRWISSKVRCAMINKIGL